MTNQTIHFINSLTVTEKAFVLFNVTVIAGMFIGGLLPFNGRGK